MSIPIESLNEIIARVEPGGIVLQSWPLSGGISCRMIGVEVERPSGDLIRLVIREVGKWSFENYPDSAHHEFRLLSHLKQHGIPTTTPRLVDLTCTLLERPFLVLEYVEGTPDLLVEDRMKRVTIMADTLARIHSVDPHHEVFSHLKPSPVNIRPSELEFDETLQESRIRQALNDSLSTVKENEYRFRHGDFWPGNILWKDGDLAAVIDWEETSIGDPLFDLAITRLDTLWAYGIEAMTKLTEVYQSHMDINFDDLPFWDLRISLRPMSNLSAWATSFPPIERPDVTVETMTSDHRWFVDQAIERLGCR